MHILTSRQQVQPTHDARPAWMRTLYTTAVDWLTLIPEVLWLLLSYNLHS